MSYNYKNEYKKWYAWKEKEEEILKALNVPQALIIQLRDYDYEQFKADRRYKTRHLLFDDNFFINRAIYDKKQYLSLNDLLDDIENETLYEYLKNNLIDHQAQGEKYNSDNSKILDNFSESIGKDFVMYFEIFSIICVPVYL